MRPMPDIAVLRGLLLFGGAAFLSVTIFFCLLRAALGPRFTDRIIAVNIIGTKVIVLIAMLSLHIGEPYLVDICLVYAIISFLSVVVLTRAFLARQARTKGPSDGGSEP